MLSGRPSEENHIRTNGNTHTWIIHNLFEMFIIYGVRRFHVIGDHIAVTLHIVDLQPGIYTSSCHNIHRKRIRREGDGMVD